MIVISILMTGRTMANIKYDSKKQFKFQICKHIIILLIGSIFIYMVTQQSKGQS
jgi:hypothetical protein